MGRDVFWVWHQVDTGGLGKAVTNFQHWGMRVGDSYFENTNQGPMASLKGLIAPAMAGDSYGVASVPWSTVVDQVENKKITVPLKYKKLGTTDVDDKTIDGWMKEYAKGRTYAVQSSTPVLRDLLGLTADKMYQALSRTKLGNCQTLVWFLAYKLGCYTSTLGDSDYSEWTHIPIPSRGGPGKCSVTWGSCSWTGTNKWCDRCGNWYCDYHSEARDQSAVAAGGFHYCYN